MTHRTPSGAADTAEPCQISLQGAIFSLVSFGPFLSSVCPLKEKWASFHLWPLKSSFPYLGFSSGPHISICTWSRPCYWPPAWAAVFHTCVAQAHRLITLLFPLLSVMWLHLGSHLWSSCPSTVCSLLSITQCAEHSVFWALRVTGLPPQHCGCLSIHAMHLSLPSSPWCLPRADLFVPVSSLLSSPFSVSFHHLSQEPKRRKEKREVHNCRIRLIRFHLHPFFLLHGVGSSIWCGARWG